MEVKTFNIPKGVKITQRVQVGTVTTFFKGPALYDLHIETKKGFFFESLSYTGEDKHLLTLHCNDFERFMGLSAQITWTLKAVSNAYYSTYAIPVGTSVKRTFKKGIHTITLMGPLFTTFGIEVVDCLYEGEHLTYSERAGAGTLLLQSNDKGRFKELQRKVAGPLLIVTLQARMVQFMGRWVL